MPEYPTNPKYNGRHYNDLADFIKALPDPGDSPAPVKAMEVIKRRVAERLADRLAADNPQFDREKFLKACGVKG